MHHPIFGHSFAVLVAPILLFALAFYFLNKKQGSARRNAEDAGAGASGLMPAPTATNSGRSRSFPVETNDSASCSSPMETDNFASRSSTPSTGNFYEVFLSFRGQDTRNGFTSHLYKGLLNAGIHAFRDDDELPLGKSAGPELMAAIKNSKILIPVLSVTYGESSWCLDDLVRIMECEKNNEQMVLPIFYKVKPAEVRHQTGSFGEAFRKRERRLLKRPSFDPTILENWKKALAEVSKLKGYEAIGGEVELVELIIQKVLSELKKKFELVIGEHLIGIDRHVMEIMEFVDNKSHVTLFVGIYGMGGIGKTTLAKTIYNMLFNRFEHHSFIANVRESWKCNGVNYLQKQLIYDILQQEIKVRNEDEGITFVSSMFKAKKILVLLDDVDNVAQLNCLAGNRDWFSSGSIIIITTRDKRILEAAETDYCYEHKEMDYDESLILFSRHAFRRDSPPREFEDLTREVVSIAGGLPLSLEVFGSLLCGKDSTEWGEMVKKLKKVPCMEVQKKLRINYEALDYGQKQIFLDIACFLIGIDERIAYYMWDACGFFPREGIEVLKFRSLIKVGYDHELIMHDQLRDLGRAIVYEKNWQQPQHRSRLWDPKEALEVLKRNKGTDKIEAISLSKGGSEGFIEVAERDGDIYTVKQFKNLTRLRFLYLEGAHLRGDFKDSIKELRWLRWPNCPTEFEVKNFHVQKLAILELSRSAIDEKWEGWSSFKMAKKLKFLDLSFCQLEQTDFLSAFKNLEVLILKDCWSLQQIDSSIGDMEALLRLDLCRCRRLKELPAEIGKLKALEQLLLSETYALSVLPDSIGSLENLEILNISFSGIEELPNSIGRLRKLQELNASYCSNLKWEIPESMSNLSSLQCLDVSQCGDLQLLSFLPSSLTCLAITCRNRELPSLSHLNDLKELRVYDCTLLQCVQELPSDLPESLNTPFMLETLNICGCDSIETLDVSQFMNLRTLSAQDCYMLLEVRGLDKLIYLELLIVERCRFKRLDLPKSECLKIVEVCNCYDLVEIQGLDRLKFLKSLNISECTSIERLLLPKSGTLKTLYAQCCKQLAEIQGLNGLEFLKELNINGCTSIERLDLPKSGSMKELDVGGCKNLAKIEGLDTLEFLEELHIDGCISIERLYLPKSGRLKKLEAEGCKNLAEIQDLNRLEFLEELNIEECISIERLCLSKSRRLKKLNAGGCKYLAEIQGLDGMLFLEELNIEGLISIERLDLSKSGMLNILKAEGCKNLAEIQDLNRLEFLERLIISGCTSIERLLLPKSSSMKALNASLCKNLAKIQDLDKLEFLEVLCIEECTSIERLDLPKSGRMKILYAEGCENLAKIEGLDKLEFLEKLHINRCTSIERLYLPKSGRLKKLKAEGCKNLAEIQGLDRLEFLEELNIKGCTSIQRLDLPKSGRLEELDAGDCENLVEIQGLDRLDFLEKLRIIGCKSLKTDVQLCRSGISEEKLLGMTESGSDCLYDSDE